MKFSKNWLKNIINIKINSYKLSNLLTMLGIEVKKTKIIKKKLPKIFLGKIIKIINHKNIKICKVNKLNTNKKIYILTKNKNIKLNLKIFFYIIKKKKPKILILKNYKINKNLSQGKLCSYYKLSLIENYNKNIFSLSKNKINKKKYFKKKIKDTLFTINIPNNRTDCSFMLGIAKEINSKINIKIKKKKYINIINTKEKLPINIINNEFCYRFSGRIIKNLNINALTPMWMKYRLKTSGKKIKSTITNIINYIILETGYIFNIIDLEKIEKNINIRFSKKNETIKLSNNKKIKIKNKTGIITDKKKILSLAGIINNKNIKITSKTKNIYIEAGCWKQKFIKKTSNKHNLFTKSSKIFEKKINYLNIINSFEKITNLIFNICGTYKTLLGPINDNLIKISKNKIILLKKKKIKKIIGINIKNIKKILKKLNLKFIKNKNYYYIIPPNYRFDLKIEEDIIEEIARIYGYKNIPNIAPKSKNLIQSIKKTNVCFTKIRYLISHLGYQEVINYSFTSNKLETDFMKNNKQIKILNPISNKMNVLRSSLIPNLILNIKHNLKYKINKIRLFEIGNIFKKNKNIQDSQYEIKGLKQEKYITCISYGKLFNEQWGINSRNVDFFDIKSDLENLFIKHKLKFLEKQHPALHPQYSLKILLNKKIIGFIGILNPILQKKYNLPFAPIIFEIKAKSFYIKKKIQYKKINKFPKIIRDISFLINKKIKFQSILDIFKKTKKKNKNLKFIKKIILFDQYQNISIKKNYKSLSFKIIIQGIKKNLNNKTINSIINFIIEEISKNYKIKLRK